MNRVCKDILIRKNERVGIEDEERDICNKLNRYSKNPKELDCIREHGNI